MTKFDWTSLKIEFSNVNGFLDVGLFNSGIKKIKNELGVINFSNYYLDFLQLTNGCFIKDELVFYGIDDIVANNNHFEVKKILDGYFAICHDAGNQLIIMRCDGSDCIYSVQFYHDLEYVTKVSPNLYDWIKSDCPTDLFITKSNKHDLYKKVDITLVKLPISGFKFLLKIKENLGLNCSINEIKNGLNKLPFTLKNNLELWEASRYCETINNIDECLAIVDHNDSEIIYPWRFEEL